MYIRRLLVTATVVPMIAFGLVSCAPEPNAGIPDEVAGAPEKGAEDDNQTGWGETSDPTDPGLKSHELPEGFPADVFVLPEGAVIDDAGDRGGVWFVVLRAADAEQADQWWTEIVQASGMSVNDEHENENGEFSAALLAPTIAVNALRVPQADGSVLLSYDITPQIL